MGPATVGATFSIDREGSFAMVSERYGTDSHQYRGVLSMYVFGTLFGAVLISLIASFATSLDIFDPLALAMGAGVGSGSMMAAAAASVAAAHPEMQEQVLAVAATSNVITGILGLYVGMYVALPLADRFYRALTKRQRIVEKPVAAAAPKAAAAPLVNVPLLTTLPTLVVVGVVVSSIAAQSFSWSIVGGYLVLAALLALGVGIARLTRGTVASMIGIVTLGALLSSPISPVADVLGTAVATIDFLSVCTVVLTVAGLSLGKDLPLLKSIGWKIAPVGIVSIAASYLLSVVVAEFALGFWN
jgi:MFS family permease